MNNIDIFELLKDRVDILKTAIVMDLKSEMKLIKEIKKVKDDNKKNKLLETMKDTRKRIVIYRKVLDDLTYAFVNSNPNLSLKIVNKLKYDNIEQYLEVNKDDKAPNLKEMVDLLVNKFHLIGLFYQYDGTNVKRDYQVLTSNVPITKMNEVKHINELDNEDIIRIEESINDSVRHK